MIDEPKRPKPLPCPLCGGHAKLDGDYMAGWDVTCCSCRCSGPRESTKELALEGWGYLTEVGKTRGQGHADLLAACKILDRVLTSGPQTITEDEIVQIQAAIEKAEPTT